jgi:hypothetical protein
VERTFEGVKATAGFVENHKVGKRAADVNADAHESISVKLRLHVKRFGKYNKRIRKVQAQGQYEGGQDSWPRGTYS